MSLASLSFGSQMIRRFLSSSMPRKVMQVAGPSVFSGSMGTPKRMHVAVITSRLCRHALECGGPTVMKSSK